MAELPHIEREDLLKYMKKYFSKLKNSKVFSILVVGETGSGKSTLVNNLLGKNVSPVGDAMESKTTDIVVINGDVEGVPVRLFDTPGLGDSRTDMDDKILADMQKVLQSTEMNVVIYCFKMSETRLRDSLVRIFQEYHKIGVNWQQTVIALTFADALPKPKSAKKAAKEKGQKLALNEVFNEKFAEWETCLRRVMLELFEIEQIRIRPTTDLISAALPNGKRWYIPFWLDVLEILSPEAKISFLEIHQQKICDENDSDFQMTLEEFSRLQHTILCGLLLILEIKIIHACLRLELEAMITHGLLKDLLTNDQEEMEVGSEDSGEENN